MDEPTPISDRCYRLAGCFGPQEIEVLDRVFNGVLAELRRTRAGVALEPPNPETRSWVASLIICHAKADGLDPVRLRASALQKPGQRASAASQEQLTGALRALSA